MTILAERLDLIKPSPTLAVMATAQKIKEKGGDVIVLAAGELDFETPDWIKQGAVQAMEQGLTRYTAVDGLPALKKAIQDKFNRENNISYNLDEIMVSSGGKQVLFNAMLCTINDGDEVIIPAPYWVSYADIVLLFGGIPVFIKAKEENDFKITGKELEAAITPKTKWLILNSPSNPTGSIYSKNELLDIANTLKKHDHVYVFSDDIYEHLTYDGTHFKSILNIAPDLKNRTLILNGFSKAFAMTGWRLGYAAGPNHLIKAMIKVQSQSTTNANSLAQGAGIIALNSSLAFLEAWKKELVERRNFCVNALNAIEGLSCKLPKGAFYIYVNCRELIGKHTEKGQLLQTDQDICHYFLGFGVAAVPGAAFGLSPYFRISFATSLENLEKAMDRLKKAISKLL